jgi:Ca2+/H+ antiporter, TMEM165/GDT1 family
MSALCIEATRRRSISAIGPARPGRKELQMIDWAHAGPSVLASFLASLVEFVEALTIVLAVGTVRGWRPALIGALAGAGALTLLVLAFGPALQRVPITTLQLVVGVLLLLFGMRWLRKAILRTVGTIGLHDEEAIYKKQTAALRTDGTAAPERLDMIAVATTFKAVMLEGLEVVFIVIAVGATANMLVPASLGALAAGVLVILLGLVVHRPLSRVPENGLKFAVGILLSAFGVFWIGEGLRFPWPGEDLSLFGLAGAFLAASAIAVFAARAASRGSSQSIGH